MPQCSLLFFSAKVPISQTLISNTKTFNSPPKRISLPRNPRYPSSFKIPASVATSPDLRSAPDDLIASILSKVTDKDRDVGLIKEEHLQVARVAEQLKKYCVEESVKCPLIFGAWDVVYCSNPTSPGCGFRSTSGRLVFKTKEMIQGVEAPDTIRNKVFFTIYGKLIPLDDKWIQVIFEPPELKVGGLDFTFGGESEVKLEIAYIDEEIRLGVGSRGSVFVFRRRKHTA